MTNILSQYKEALDSNKNIVLSSSKYEKATNLLAAISVKEFHIIEHQETVPELFEENELNFEILESLEHLGGLDVLK